MNISFNSFLEGIRNNQKNPLIEVCIEGFSAFMESLSTDDANTKPFTGVVKDLERGKINKGIEDSEYFNQTLSPDKVNLVKQSQFGLGRVAAYPAAGRTISGNDPSTNQFTGSQYYAGDGGGETGN
jgi:hypothetical protein